MKRLLAGTALAALLASGAAAQNIGVSMALFDDNFLTVLRNGMQEYADGLEGVSLQVEDAQDDVGKQLNQIQNFVASGVDAIIVNPVDTDATVAMSQAAADAGIPLVYVNREPINVDELPDNQAFVASDEREVGHARDPGGLPAAQGGWQGRGREDPRADGPAVEPGGAAAHPGRSRRDRHRRVQLHGDRRGADRQLGAYRGHGPDDQLAVVRRGVRRGRLQQRRDGDRRDPVAEGGRKDMGEVIVGGVDATQDALAAMAAGDLDVTVFQNAAGQGQGAVDAALKLVEGEAVEQKVYIPFELVTPANLKDYQALN